MTAIESESSLASKCLDLCQTLASQGQPFTLSVTIGSTFNFSMRTGSQESPAPKAKAVVKKKSPSKQRRNARRKKEFLRRKSQTPASTHVKPVRDSTDATLVGQEVELEITHKEKTFKCDQCDSKFKSENGLKIHSGKSHKTVKTPPPPDRLRQQLGSPVAMPTSPLLDASREEVGEEEEPDSFTPFTSTCKECEEEIREGWNHGPDCHGCGETTKYLCEDCCYEQKVRLTVATK